MTSVIAMILTFIFYPFLYMYELYQVRKGKVFCEICQMWSLPGDCLCEYRKEWSGII